MSALALMYRAVAGEADICTPQFIGDPYEAFDSYPSPARPGIEIETDGTITRFTSTTNNILIGRWDGGCGTLNMADYDFRIDGGPGTPDPIEYPEGVWHPGVNTIFWLLNVVGSGLQIYTGTIKIRPTGGGDTIDIATVTIEADLT